MTINRRHLIAAGAAGLALPFIARAAPTQTPARRIETGKLKAGEFVWQPELAPEGPVTFIVSIPDQLVHVYRNGVEIGVSTCSTGKAGHGTPTGVFVILQKDRHHHSSTYNNAPMPNMQRLTWSGIALHAGDLPGYPASHGCVRLPKKFSELIFSITHLGVPVIIADGKSQPAQVVHPGLLLPPEADRQAHAALAAAAAKAPHPLDATTETHDAISVVMSGADRRATFFADGEIAFESPLGIRDPQKPLGDHVYKLLGMADDGRSQNWLVQGVRGDAVANTLSDPVLSRLWLERWQESGTIIARMSPGTSLVVTDLPAGPDTRTGPDFVVIADEESQA